MKYPVMISSLMLLVGLGVGAAGYAWLKAEPSLAPTPAPKVRASLPSASNQPPAAVHAKAPSTVERIVDGFLAVDWSDSVALIRASGDLHGLADDGIRAAWKLLESRAHTGTHQEKALALYLWSRLARLDPSLRLPEAWSRDMSPEALLAERVRQSMDTIRQRLIAGESMDVYERKAFFKELADQDPAAGLEFWLGVSNHLEHIGELSPFGVLLRDPTLREATLAKVRAAAASPGDAAELITALAHSWVVADLADAGAWISTLGDPELKKRLTALLLVSSAGALPVTTFEVTANLPADQRTSARATGLAQLAYEDPASGMLLLDTVEDPAERRELVRVFGNTLAMHDTEAWLAWRETLPPEEHDHANSAAFTSWAIHQPSDAAAWLSSHPPGQDRDQLAAELVRITAATQTETAIRWIQEIANPRDRLMAISMALGNLAPGDTQRMETILRASLPPAAGR